MTQKSLFFSSGFEIYIFQSLSTEKSAKSSLNSFLSEIISANFHSIFDARKPQKKERENKLSLKEEEQGYLARLRFSFTEGQELFFIFPLIFQQKIKISNEISAEESSYKLLLAVNRFLTDLNGGGKHDKEQHQRKTETQRVG